MAVISPARLGPVFAELIGTLVDDFDLIEFLHVLTVRVAGLSGTAAVVLMLTDHRGRLYPVAVSQEEKRFLELAELQDREGPCWEAFHTALPIVNMHLATDRERWPEFAARALQAGFESAQGFPLRLHRKTVGAMGVFGRADDLDEADIAIMQSLADLAVIGLLQEHAGYPG